ncbi:MAG: gliding motility-associated C-terminal domain-containing protein, partial [Chitinophagaceae bacterium]
SGPVDLCDLSKTFHFETLRNAGCDLKPIWSFDTSFVSVSRPIDDTLDLQFKKTGSTWIVAQLNAGCKIYYDSLLVNVQAQPAQFSLGADTVVCPGATLELKAGNGFTSYRWNDGSTAESLIVSTPGKYYVDVRNSCGDVGSDTIVVTSTTVPSLELGNNTVACIGDTLQLLAPPGFATYDWTGPALNSLTGPAVFILPQADGDVSLVATTSQGCKAVDTLFYTTRIPTPVSLPADTGFCAGNTLLLDAGGGFSSYRWNDGSTSPSIAAATQGFYSIEVTDANGCHARDTLQLLVYDLPAVNLGADFDLCKDSDKQLDAGVYVSYNWQDGSTSRYLTVAEPGTYWVRVQSQQLCVNTDSLVIRSIIPLPANFLNALDSVCSYDHISIKPTGNYSGYNWSTGASSSAISINQPGTYTLTVTDAAGCKGSDTIVIVPKTCYTGIYMPTVFTPNGDGINDVFKAGVWGNVLQYKLQVFNRWGQLIYQTTDASKGWDGRVNGVLADGNVFVWQCTYNIEGQQPGYLKGTVNLIR